MAKKTIKGLGNPIETGTVCYFAGKLCMDNELGSSGLYLYFMDYRLGSSPRCRVFMDIGPRYAYYTRCSAYCMRYSAYYMYYGPRYPSVCISGGALSALCISVCLRWAHRELSDYGPSYQFQWDFLLRQVEPGEQVPETRL